MGQNTPFLAQTTLIGYYMVFHCIAWYCIVFECIALHRIALHRIAWHCIEFDYLLWGINNLQPPGPLPLPILPTSNGNGPNQKTPCMFGFMYQKKE